MSNLLLSISIPTYNRAQLLKQNLLNLIYEINKYDLSEYIEINILDNKSTDKTFKVCKEIKKKYKEIQYSRNSNNIGMKKNIIKAIKQSRGAYVWVLGDDDYLIKGAIKRILSNIIKYNPSIYALGHKGISTVSPDIHITDRVGFITFLSKLPFNDLLFRWGAISLLVVKNDVYNILSNVSKKALENEYVLHSILLQCLPKDRYLTDNKPAVICNLAKTGWRKDDYKTVTIISKNYPAIINFNKYIPLNFVIVKLKFVAVSALLRANSVRRAIIRYIEKL